jgi:hypothetical protein
MELNEENLMPVLNHLTQKSEFNQATMRKTSLEIDLIIMQAQALRDLSVNISNYVKDKELSDFEFNYWMEKANEYWMKSCGFNGLRDLKIEYMKVIITDFAKEVRSYGLSFIDEDLNKQMEEYLKEAENKS